MMPWPSWSRKHSTPSCTAGRQAGKQAGIVSTMQGAATNAAALLAARLCGASRPCCSHLLQHGQQRAQRRHLQLLAQVHQRAEVPQLLPAAGELGAAAHVQDAEHLDGLRWQQAGAAAAPSHVWPSSACGACTVQATACLPACLPACPPSAPCPR
jgi:hypothetical protein